MENENRQSTDLLPPAFIVSGTHSGVGKTTISYGLIALFNDLGYVVQPFKVGPDFIDGSYHVLAAGRPSINLDRWMMGDDLIKKSFISFSADADISVIEGMGALYDGENGVKEEGSAAYMAKLMDIPVVLVIDAWGLTRTAHAILNGLIGFDPKLNVCGIIFNRTGSAVHYGMIYDSLSPELQAKTWGHVPRNKGIEIPERHLGLLTVEENDHFQTRKQLIVDVFKEHLDMETIKACLRRLSEGQGVAPPGPPITLRVEDSQTNGDEKGTDEKIRLAIAKDKAFCFYYYENLRMLENAGAELVYFSPVEDNQLPPDIHGIYLGGGYPESFAAELAENHAMKQAIKDAAENGMPIYAECGGFMYLGQSLTNFDGNVYEMASVFPLDFLMDKKSLTIKYIDVETTGPSIFGENKMKARGHEFHYSRITSTVEQDHCFSGISSRGQEFMAGDQYKNVMGSYMHLHFFSNPQIVDNFIVNCRK